MVCVFSCECTGLVLHLGLLANRFIVAFTLGRIIPGGVSRFLPGRHVLLSYLFHERE